VNDRRVFCSKLEKELPGLAKPPFPGELGQEIFDHVSAEAWEMWLDLQIKLINEYHLNMGQKKDFETVVEQMRQFLNLKIC